MAMSSTERSRKRRRRLGRDQNMRVFGCDLAELSIDETLAKLRVTDEEMAELLQPMRPEDWARIRL